MNKKVVIIKVSNRSADSNNVKQAFSEITKHFEESYSSHSMGYYLPTDNASITNLYFLTEDEEYQITSQNNYNKIKNKINKLKEDDIIYHISHNKSNLFFVLCYGDSNEKTLYVGEGPIQIQKGSSKLKFYYQILLKYTFCENKLIINNFEKLQFIEEGDFEGFMICCENMDLVKQFRYIIEQKKENLKINYLDTIEKNNMGTSDKTSENGQAEAKPEEAASDEISDEGQTETIVFEGNLKQQDDFCERPFSIPLKLTNTKRTNFQRDYERIIHAKAFRRLVDKAQIFTSSKGDHYRTRMTHTMEVAQIARGIAKELDLNIELTEAIALAHDIGHTPFGHQGERTLNDILNGNIELICNRKNENFYGGFKHNLQGIRVVTVLEEKYYEHDGINLSYQVLEGILKHTSFLSCKCCEIKKNNLCEGMQGKCIKTGNDLKDFLPENFDDNKLYSGYKFSTTLEGQVVAIADEIAQRSHDIDDALRSNLITFQDLKNYLCFEKFKELKKIITEIENKFINNEEEILFNNGEDYTAPY